MANFVTKKDGTRVPFDAGKIKAAIMAAALEAEMTEEEAGNVAETVSSMVVTSFEGQEEAAGEEVREKILSELDVSHPLVAESWRRYEEGKGA